MRFKTAKDFENPQDADRDNIYEVGIRLTDDSQDTSFYHAYIKVSDVEYEGKSLKAEELERLNKLKSSTPTEDAWYGTSVAVDGNMAVIGEYGYDSERGRAHVYEYNASSHLFEEVAILEASDGESEDYFGYSVAISGDTVVVGAYGDDDRHENSGAAYIYKKPQGGWANAVQENAKLKASDADVDDEFGSSVAISGDTVVVGAPVDDDMNINSGAVYLYEKPQNGWVDSNQTAKLKASDADVEDNFGCSVAISGDTVVVGADSDHETANYSGAAYIYEKPLNGWANSAQENAKLRASDADGYDFFGISVAISGDTVVIGALGDDETNSNSGAAYVFEKPQSGWVDSAQENAKLKASDADADDEFGSSVAISGDTVVVGAMSDDETNSDSGAAYVYEKPQSGWADTAQENAKLKAPDADEYDEFGFSVAISGDTLVIGSDMDSETVDNSGAAYVYKAKNTEFMSAIIMYLLD